MPLTEVKDRETGEVVGYADATGKSYTVSMGQALNSAESMLTSREQLIRQEEGYKVAGKAGGDVSAHIGLARRLQKPPQTQEQLGADQAIRADERERLAATVELTIPGMVGEEQLTKSGKPETVRVPYGIAVAITENINPKIAAENKRLAAAATADAAALERMSDVERTATINARVAKRTEEILAAQAVDRTAQRRSQLGKLKDFGSMGIG